MIEKLVIRTLLVIPKKIISFLIFPFIYPFRNKVWKSPTAYSNMWFLDKVKQENRGIKLFVWFFLDDSIYSETNHYYNTRKNNLCKYHIYSEFLNSWYWNGVRNTSNNLSHYISKGKMIKVLRVYNTTWYHYEVREFPKGRYPYLEIYAGKYVFNVGWLSSGKFEGVKVRKRLN